ncbi:hypothetical protein CTAYLR_000834 [Chrysophaeum taylorii]|uniref:Uncharacterized protein n=1 Tax=Chrysophaeum taylorii TaxID=2483200 RepID=A0AAD7UQ65_9STRA|nr:hypothetical protein CTAYLR_000834 [Chrysophaeum taylorii]
MMFRRGMRALSGYAGLAEVPDSEPEQELVSRDTDDIEQMVASSRRCAEDEEQTRGTTSRLAEDYGGVRSPLEPKVPTVEVRVVCAYVERKDSSPRGAWRACVATKSGRSSPLRATEARAVVFEEQDMVRVSDATVRVAVTCREPEVLTMIAELDVSSAPTGRMVWLECKDAVTEQPTGRVCVTWTRVEEDQTQDEATRCADRLFDHYCSSYEGMSRDDLRDLVRASIALGGNLQTLGGFERHGLIAKCISIPDEGLFAYVLHRHCVFRVCYGAVGLGARSTWQSRTVLVVVSLLWSFSANCLVSAIVIPRADRIVQVIVIMLVDTFGVGVLTVLFTLVHTPFVERVCAPAYRLNLPAFATTLFSFATLILLIVSLTEDELCLAAYSFFPIYGTARVTEIFKLGTYWAMQVQLGSFPPRDKSAHLPPLSA